MSASCDSGCPAAAKRRTTAIGSPRGARGLLPVGGGSGAVTTAWSAAIGMIVSYGASRRLVRRRGRFARHAVIWTAWALIYGTALAVGVAFFRGQLAYWLPMAVVVSAPLLLGAWWASRP
jgi:hypothetical protein